jgi:hypothetical protein
MLTLRSPFARLAGPFVAFALLAVLVVSTTSTVLAADPRDFTMVNNSSSTIEYLYVSPTSWNDWGNDVLGSTVLLPYRRVNVTFSRFRAGNCLYDIKVITRAGRSSMLKSVNLCTTTTVTYN